MVHEFDGTKHGKLRDMQAARRAKYTDLARCGMNFTQAAHAAGASKRTGKAWRNGRTRPTGRNERPLVGRYRGGMGKPKQIDARYLRMDERITMRRGRTARRPRCDGQSRHPRSREPMAMTGDRPAEVTDRAVPDHREGDLICGAGNRSATGTLVEHTTRSTILPHLPDRHDAEHAQDAIIRKTRMLPAPLPDSLTWDQGSEPALRTRVSAALDMQAYFCDPRSPWRRGSNENTNGLPRQYFPKSTDLSGYTEEHLDAAATDPDDRPRKTPDHMKPNEKILELTDNTATSTPTVNKDVATTTRIRQANSKEQHRQFEADPIFRTHEPISRKNRNPVTPTPSKRNQHHSAPVTRTTALPDRCTRDDNTLSSSSDTGT